LTTPGYNTSANNAITINQKLRGIEVAAARGPVKFQMETFNSQYDASGISQTLGSTTTANHAMGVQVKADYIELMYNITGESFAESYRGGTFGGIKPKTNVTDFGGVVGYGPGAWQVGFRTSKYSAEPSCDVIHLYDYRILCYQCHFWRIRYTEVAYKTLKPLVPTPMLLTGF
jgi:phosphate-selective porin